MLSTLAKIGFVCFSAHRMLSAGVLLTLFSIFLSISAGTAQACPPDWFSESSVAATRIATKHYKMANVRPAAELRSATVHTSFKVIGVCCGSVVPGSNCPSFSCSMCFAGLPASVSSVSPPEVVSSRDVADDIGLVFSEPRADFHPPRDIA